MQKILFTLLLLTAIPFGKAQDVQKLRAELYNNSKTRLQTAMELRAAYSDISNDSLYGLGTFLVDRGIKTDNQAVLMYGKLVLADYYNGKGKTDFSTEYLSDCIRYYEKNGDLEKLADAENQMGIAGIYNSEYNKAAHWFIRSIKTSDKLGENNKSYMGQLNLAEVYIRENKLDLAESEVLSYIERTRKQNLMLGLKKGYDYLAKIYMIKGDMSLAIAYYKKALELALKNGSKLGKANAYNNMAIAHFEMGESSLALENFKKALQLRLELNEPKEITESYYNLGDWNFYTDHYNEAIRYYKISLDVASRHGLVREMADAYQRIAETYEVQGNYRLAYENLKKHLEQVEIMRRRNQVKEIDLQRASYELERQEQLLEQQKREKRIRKNVETEQDRGRIIVIGFSLVIGILIISYFFLLAKSRKQIRNGKVNGDAFSSREESYRLQESKWNRMEHFITRNTESNVISPEVRGLENFNFLKLCERDVLFWETSVSPLENYVLREYLRDMSETNASAEEMLRVMEGQKLVDAQDLTFGILTLKGNVIEISGENGLLIQDRDKMSFLTKTAKTFDTFVLLISDRFKNELVVSGNWDKFMDQVTMIRKMSPAMAYQTMSECWSEMLQKEKAGLMLYLPGGNSKS